MIEINIFEKTGKFAVSKDIARDIRLNELLPALEKDEIVLNFQGVDSATQSFIHALLSDVIRNKGINILDKLTFKDCNKTVQKIITIVIEYMQNV